MCAKSFRIRAPRGLVACAPSCLTAKTEKFQLQNPALPGVPGFCFPAQHVQPGSSPLSHLVELFKVYSGQIVANNHNTFVRPFKQIPNPLPVRTRICNWTFYNTTRPHFRIPPFVACCVRVHGPDRVLVAGCSKSAVKIEAALYTFTPGEGLCHRYGCACCPRVRQNFVYLLICHRFR